MRTVIASGAALLLGLGIAAGSMAAQTKPAPGRRPAVGRTAFGELAPPRKPRLVVLIAIDQFRADLVTRFEDLYLPPRSGGSSGDVGGFRYLQALGAWFPDCRYQHHRTVTAAGHAILGTGAQPYLSGMVGNSWWDRASGRSIYCCDDPKARVVGAAAGSIEKPMSPANLLVTTFADELELATGGRAKTVGVAMKDRAAILMIGHRADTCIWFDEVTGGWVSSSFYCPNEELPAWVQQFNRRRLAEQLRKKPWTPLIDSAALERVWRPKAGSFPFSYSLEGRDFNNFINSPAGNEFTIETARQAVVSEGLGQDDIPDVLAINLTSNDTVGHRFGPDSAEVEDISVQTDRQLSKFFNFLAKSVPGGLGSVTIALSSDHGVVTVPEVNTASGVSALRSAPSAVAAAADRALDAAVGTADWIASSENGELYFSTAALARYPAEPRSRLENVAIEAIRAVPGVYSGYGKSAILAGSVPRTALGARLANGVHPNRSGDVVVILDPHWLPGANPVGTGTSHGSPFPYDTNVALLVAGAGIRPGTYRTHVTPAQVAPTMSFLLRVNRPSGADEPLLPGLIGTE